MIPFNACAKVIIGVLTVLTCQLFFIRPLGWKIQDWKTQDFKTSLNRLAFRLGIWGLCFFNR